MTELEKLKAGLEYCYDDEKDIPDNCVVGGVPARFIKEIENDVES
jgi:hypothetical protein